MLQLTDQATRCITMSYISMHLWILRCSCQYIIVCSNYCIQLEDSWKNARSMVSGSEVYIFFLNKLQTSCGLLGCSTLSMHTSHHKEVAHAAYMTSLQSYDACLPEVPWHILCLHGLALCIA